VSKGYKAFLLFLIVVATATATAAPKPRIIVLTDISPVAIEVAGA
jgi:hypothetical protein